MYTRRPSLVLPLAALAIALLPAVAVRSDADRKITIIMNNAALDKTESGKVWDAAHDNKCAATAPSAQKACTGVRAVMLDHKFFFRPQP